VKRCVTMCNTHVHLLEGYGVRKSNYLLLELVNIVVLYRVCLADTRATPDNM
jgi:hypothetical protein